MGPHPGNVPRLPPASLARQLAVRRSESRPSTATTSLPPPRTGSTILLVDDDPAIRESLRRVLATEGWNVETAESGEAALRRLNAREPDLLITDLGMADVSGWDLLFHESLQRPHLPIFVITALPRYATAGADKFACEFFPKPLDLDALLAAIRHRLGPTP